MNRSPLRISVNPAINVGLLLALGLIFCSAAMAAGIVKSVGKSSIIADGNVSGEPTNILGTLDGSLDPSIDGRSLAAGDEIRVIFPPQFDLSNLDLGYPLRDVPWPLPPVPPLPPMPCVPGNLQCTTAVILHGWPQQPFFPPALFHQMSIDLIENALVFTALQDLVPDGPTRPGIKQLLLILNGLINPQPGEYLLQVEAQTGPDGAWESGSGIYRVLPRTRPSVNVTSVFVAGLAGLTEPVGVVKCVDPTLPPNPYNPVYQHTLVGEDAPFFWTLLLWGKNKEPLEDVSLAWSSDNHARLVRGKTAIGNLFIDAPAGASGYDVEVNPEDCPTLLPGAPVIAGTPGIGPQPVGRLDLRFRAGDVAGEYTTTISMNNGNSVELVVVAE
jgi:hypothetical protein